MSRFFWAIPYRVRHTDVTKKDQFPGEERYEYSIASVSGYSQDFPDIAIGPLSVLKNRSAFARGSIFSVITRSFAPNLSLQKSDKAIMAFGLPVTGRQGQKYVGTPMATVHIAFATSILLVASAKHAIIGYSWSFYFPEFNSASRKSAPFQSMIEGVFSPREERRSIKPSPQVFSG